MSKQIVEVELQILSCKECGCTYGVPQGFIDQRRRTHATYYCPNGHAWHFPGESDLEKLEKENRLLRENLQWESNYAREQRELKEAMERSLAATKGVITRMKNRAANGVCPCCNRYFANLHRHMTTKHPDYRNSDVE